jgi:hypothetical protein
MLAQPRVAVAALIPGATRIAFKPAFGVPVVLMAQDGLGRPTFYGRQDIARFLSGVPLNAIPWREYTIN